MAVILFGFQIFLLGPQQKEAMEAQRKQDSIAKVEYLKFKADSLARFKADTTNSTAKIRDTTVLNDSSKKELNKQQFGTFAEASTGTPEFVTLENNLVKITISTKGGKVYSAELKKYKTYDSLPLRLFDGDSTVFGMELPTNENRVVNTNELYFKPSSKAEVVGRSGSKSISMRLYAGGNRYIEYLYTLPAESYLVDFNLNTVGMNQIVPQNTNYFERDWSMNVARVEKNISAERNASTMYFKYLTDNDVDWLSETKNDTKSLVNKVQWVSMKQQFFTSVLMSKEGFEKATIGTRADANSTTMVKNMSGIFTLPFNHNDNATYAMSFYFGPNHYQTLKKMDMMLSE